MDSLWVAAGSAFWFGILTSISPCPLATNIVAVSFISKEIANPRRAILSGILYTMGRMLAYIGLAAIVVFGLLSIPSVANFLQDYMDKLLGPLLIIVGILLFDMFGFKISGTGSGQKTENLAKKWGVWGAMLLGIIFALSLCPISAGLFFGSLIPLALRHKSYLLMPGLYGIGTGLPVILFGFVIAFSASSVGRLFNSITIVEKWLRRVTALTIIGIGLHYIMRYNFGLY